MSTAIHRMVEAARRGENPNAIARCRSGWLVAGERQPVRGYCLLLPDPVVATLNDLVGEARRRFLDDMAAAGDALLEVTAAARINYEILGNLEPALHAHLFPRYADEPEALRHKPVFAYDWSVAPSFDAATQARFVTALRSALRRQGVAVDDPRATIET